MILRIILVIVITLLEASCSFNFEVGIETIPVTEAYLPATNTIATLPAITPTTSPTKALTKTSSPTPLAHGTATDLPNPPTETPTKTPSPTPLPGLVVLPIDSLGNDIPWLPLDRTRWPVVHIVTINNQLPPFDNPLVRQAFAASIDREVITEMAKKWYAVDPSPATTFIPSETLGRNLYGDVGINFDPIHAKDLLAQAGYTDVTTFPKVSFIVNTYGDTAPGARFNMANAMADMWHSHLGVTVEVEALPPASFRERIRSNPPAFFWVGWTVDPGNDPDFMRDIFHSNADFNYGYFSNLTFDSLVEQAAAMHDPAMRQVLYIEAERLLCETEASIIPLYHTFTNIP